MFHAVSFICSPRHVIPVNLANPQDNNYILVESPNAVEALFLPSAISRQIRAQVQTLVANMRICMPAELMEQLVARPYTTLLKTFNGSKTTKLPPWTGFEAHGQHRSQENDISYSRVRFIQLHLIPLAILHELDRGTSNHDGVAVAQAVLHHVATHIGCIGFFATHYHSLAADFSLHPEISSKCVAIMVDDIDSPITLLYKLEPGVSRGSLGIQHTKDAAKEWEYTRRLQMRVKECKDEELPLGLLGNIAWMLKTANDAIPKGEEGVGDPHATCGVFCRTNAWPGFNNEDIGSATITYYDSYSDGSQDWSKGWRYQVPTMDRLPSRKKATEMGKLTRIDSDPTGPGTGTNSRARAQSRSEGTLSRSQSQRNTRDRSRSRPGSALGGRPPSQQQQQPATGFGYGGFDPQAPQQPPSAFGRGGFNLQTMQQTPPPGYAYQYPANTYMPAPPAFGQQTVGNVGVGQYPAPAAAAQYSAPSQYPPPAQHPGHVAAGQALPPGPQQPSASGQMYAPPSIHQPYAPPPHGPTGLYPSRHSPYQPLQPPTEQLGALQFRQPAQHPHDPFQPPRQAPQGALAAPRRDLNTVVQRGQQEYQSGQQPHSLVHQLMQGQAQPSHTPFGTPPVARTSTPGGHTISPPSNQQPAKRHEAIPPRQCFDCSICGCHRAHVDRTSPESQECIYCHGNRDKLEERCCDNCHVSRSVQRFTDGDGDIQKTCSYCTYQSSIQQRRDAESASNAREDAERREGGSLVSSVDPTGGPSPLTRSDRDLLATFQASLTNARMVACSRCRRHALDMPVNAQGVCDPCTAKDANKDKVPGTPYCFSVENHMVPRKTPGNLPKLTLVEQLLISVSHPLGMFFIAQSGRQGRIVNFLLDYVRTYTSLPPRLVDLQIVIFHYGDRSQFAEDCTVTRGNVEAWLRHLREHNPAYHGIELNDANLQSLPHTAQDVSDRLNNIMPSMGTPPVVEPTILPPQWFCRTTVFSPDSDPLQPQDPSSEFFYNRLNLPADCRYVPLYELNKTRSVLRHAVPYLYPYGDADFLAPRSVDVNLGDYAQYLIQHSERDFGSHPLWLNLVFGLLQRRQHQKVFDNLRKPQLELLSLDQDSIPNDRRDDHRAAINYVVEHSKHLRGTSSYWYTKAQELAAYVATLKHPHLFFTLTLNREWPDLQRILNPQGLPGTDLQTLAIQNPHLVVQHFVRRMQLLQKDVITPKFGIQDHWGRYEFTAAGGIHFHTTQWSKDSVLKLPLEKDDYQEFVQFWSRHISAVLPEGTTQQHDSLRRSVLKYQTHHHNSSCVRQGAYTCGFPRDNAEAQVVAAGPQPRFQPKREHPMISQFSRILTSAWDGNHDVQPLTGNVGILAYASKGQPVTQMPEGINTHALLTAHIHAKSTIALVLGGYQPVSEQREWGAQEICMLLMRSTLTQKTRQVLRVDTRPTVDQPLTTRGTSILSKYKNDTSGPRKVFLRWLQRRGLERLAASGLPDKILQYIPNYSATDSDPGNVENHFRFQLMLNNAFQDETVLKSPLQTWQYAWELYVNSNAQILNTHLGDPRPVIAHQNDERLARLEWDGIARLLNPAGASIGSRPIDRTGHDWVSGGNWPESVLNGKWWEKLEASVDAANLTTVRRTDLNREQLQLYDYVMKWAEGNCQEQLLLHLDGRAGTGKTILTLAMSDALNAMFDTSNATLRIAPTGKAAKEIRGQTVHAALGISIREEPTDKVTPEIAAKLKEVRLIIIDEKSMISNHFLGQVNDRLKTICESEKDFGGKSVIFSGDFFQLPPVGGTPMFMVNPLASDADKDLEQLYSRIDKSVFLTTPMRQKDAAFDAELTKIRNGDGDAATADYLSGRVLANMRPPQQVRNFELAPRVYTTNQAVDAYNLERIKVNRLAVRTVKARDVGNSRMLREKSPLPPVCHLQLGLRVMIVYNIHVDRGVVNGTLGHIKQVIWADGADVLEDDPVAVLVAIDDWHQGDAEIEHELVSCVPIFKVTLYSEGGTRTQFPLVPAYAFTAHKAQGSTLDNMVVNLAKKDFAAGQTYTILSRVRELDDLMIETGFPRDRFLSNTINIEVNDVARNMKADAYRRSFDTLT
ncbi:hypothetical protein KCU78_g2545, partial [Aureobasidium melanogenum]